MHVTEFSAELSNTEVSFVALIKSDSTKDTLSVILKVLGTFTGITYGEVRFLV